MDTAELVGRSIVSFLAYLSTTFLALSLLAILNDSGETLNGVDSLGEITSAFVVFGYAVAGWLLCSLINGELIKSWRHFSLSNRKPISILNTK